MSRKLVCDAEAGKLTMQVDGLVKICRALGCDLVVRVADPGRLGYRDALAPAGMTSRALRVRVGGRRAATVAHQAHGAVLAYEADYLASAEAVPLSLSLPLRAQPHEGPSRDGLARRLAARPARAARPVAPSRRRGLVRRFSTCSRRPSARNAQAQCSFEPDEPSRPESALVPVSDAELAVTLRAT